MYYTAPRIPSPCAAGRGTGRGVSRFRIGIDFAFGQRLQRLPLSPLLRRGEREKSLRRNRPLRFVGYPVDCSASKCSRSFANALARWLILFFTSAPNSAND